MSRIDVDDLVAAFKSQAVSQEAMDLITLQKQLAQTLRPYASSSYHHHGATSPSPIQTSIPSSFSYSSASSSNNYPSTSYGLAGTPTSATASQNPFWGQAQPVAGTSTPVLGRSRSLSRSTTATAQRKKSVSTTSEYPATSSDWDEMQEVEEELDFAMQSDDLDAPSSSSSYYSNQQYQQYPQSQYQQQHQQQQSSDPFFLATATTASSNPSYPSSTQNANTNWFAQPGIGFGTFVPPVSSRWSPTAHHQGATQVGFAATGMM